jgi:hypothetical protein
VRHSAGDDEYFRELLQSEDEYVSIGSINALIDRVSDLALVSRLSEGLRYPSVRSKLLANPTGVPAEYLERIVDSAGLSVDAVRQRAMLAELKSNSVDSETASGELFLATGNVDHLLAASQHTEAHSGWRAAISWVLRAAVISPRDPRAYARLYTILSQAEQPDLMDEVAHILESSRLHPQIAVLFRAGVALKRGDANSCLALLEPLTRGPQQKLVVPMLGSILQLRALATEKVGNYLAAYEHYRLLHDAGRSPTIKPVDFYAASKAREGLAVPPLPRVDRTDVAQMLGFPRSGTTLLENVLAAHPAIETFEEIPALQAAYAQIERAASDQPAGSILPVEPYLRARAKYFEEIDLRRRKPTANVLIDKMPLRTAEIGLLDKLFSEWRYIFSIRHPFDVVLSCFKQRFQPNVAMENFRSIEDAARLYDYAMTQWFRQFTMDSPRVCYVRYEDLVLEFEPTIRRVLDFVGVGWDDAVTDFAAASESRAARTPSYQKVRQGLGIGVQTSWRNYDFIFKTKAADPLRKWVEFFGYEATP